MVCWDGARGVETLMSPGHGHGSASTRPSWPTNRQPGRHSRVAFAGTRLLSLPVLRLADPPRQGRQHPPRGTEAEAECETPAPRLATADGEPAGQEAHGGPGQRWHAE